MAKDLLRATIRKDRPGRGSTYTLRNFIREHQPVRLFACLKSALGFTIHSIGVNAGAELCWSDRPGWELSSGMGCPQIKGFQTCCRFHHLNARGSADVNTATKSPLSKTTLMINWLNTNQGAVMAVLTLVYVVATIFLVRLSNRQLHSTYLLEKARTRANPILSLEVKHYSLVVVLQNIGQTPALKISFSLSPELKTVFGGDNEVPREKREILIPFLTNGVESLAPGARVDTVIGSWRRVVEAYPGLTWSGTMTFTDMWNEVHQASVTLDARAYENRMVVARRDIHDVHAVLAKIESTFGRLLTMFRDQQVTLSVAPTKNAGAPDDSAQAEQGASPKES